MFRKASVVAVAALRYPLDRGAASVIATPRPWRFTACDFGSHTRALRSWALAAAVVQNGRMFATGAVGTRPDGAPIPVTMDDRFPGR